MSKSDFIDIMYRKLIENSDPSTTIKVIHGKDGKPGRPGKDGINGRDGIDGKNGRDGVDGKDGLKGEKGDPGPRGLKGDKGDPGKDGKDGKHGFAGKDGKDGLDGKNGRDGKDGIDGKDGLNGKDGRDGLDGLNGKDGKDGRDGLDGLKGDKGDPGKDGLNGKDGRGISYIKFENDSIVFHYTDKTKTDVKIVDFDKINGSSKALQLELENLKKYIDKRVSTAIMGSGGGGNVSAQISEIYNRVDNLNMITPFTINEYLWKINTTQANGGNVTISFKNGLYQKINLTANSTISLADFPDVDYLGRLTLEIINNGMHTLTFTDTVLWNFGEPPDFSLGSAMVVLTTSDSGTTIFGNVAGQQYST